MSNIKKSILILMASSFLFCARPASAADEGRPRRGLAKIIFAGLGGAVLGLSTLSFYGEPQEHLNNISVGFAAGIIIGTGFAAYDAAASASNNDFGPLHGKGIVSQPTNPAQRYAFAPTPLRLSFEF